MNEPTTLDARRAHREALRNGPCPGCGGPMVRLSSGALCCTQPACPGWVAAADMRSYDEAAFGPPSMAALADRKAAIGQGYCSTGNDQDSRARAFSTDRRSGLGLIEQHRPAECPRCGDPLVIGRCLACERERAEWDRIERKAAGVDDDAPGWRGLALACLLWLAAILLVAALIAGKVQP